MSKMKFGLKCGLFFGIIGIPISLILSSMMAIFLESVAEALSCDIWDFSFYVSLVILLIPIGYYLYCTFLKKELMESALIILFVVFIAFINVNLFYHFYAGNTDGQIAFALFAFPLKTAILYPLIGVFHDAIAPKKHANST